MASFPLSPDQQSVVDSRDQNILVSAAAGSGKTRVLTERIVGRVTDPDDPIDIDRVLVVTFTEAAAKEMKERIGKALNDAIAKHPGDRHLEKQASLIHNAQITTIDSFCLHVFKDNFHKIGADPAFRVMSEGEKKLLMQEVMDKLMEDCYDLGDEGFHHLVDCYSRKSNDDSLEKSIVKLFNFACSYPWPTEWLNKRKQDYSFDSAKDLAGSELLGEIYAICIEICRKLAELAERAVLLAREDEASLEAMIRNCSAEKGFFEELIEGFLEGRDFDEMRKRITLFSFPNASSKKNVDPEIKAGVYGLRGEYKDAFEKMGKSFFYDSAENMVKAMQTAGRNVNRLVDLTISFAERFDAAKRDRGVIDFSDMEHMAVDILVDKERSAGGNYVFTDAADQYREYYREVMCDEYQDSNHVQELILASISRPEGEAFGNRFMVGDVKQSIYSFRMARPEIFMSKAAGYSKDPKAPDRLITLKNNYRSRDCVIDSVNAIFEDIMTASEGGVDYDEDQRLYRGADYPADDPENITEVLLTDNTGGASKAREREAAVITSKIRSMVGRFAVTDAATKGYRPARYGDIAILFRSPSKWTGIISRALEEAGIPYHMEGVGNFYEAREIRDVISFLEVIDNPLSDIPLYAAMTSYFGGFTDEECAGIKVGAEGYYLWDRVCAFHSEHPENKKLNAFIDRVEHYRDMVTGEPIDAFLSRLLDETGFKHVAAALPDGRQRLANLELLLEKARDYAKSSFKGLFHFLRFVELIRKTGTEEGEAGTSEENFDVVRVMSIHKSKGLEFPICFVSGLSDRFNRTDASAAFASNMDAGIGAYAIDPVRRVKTPTLRRAYVTGKICADALSEEIRVLYVALTRAREKLILTASVKEPEEWFSDKPGSGDSCYADLIRTSVNSRRNIVFKPVIVSAGDIEAEEIESKLDRAVLRTELEAGVSGDRDTLLRLRDRFSYRYPKSYPAGMSIKTTVSRLKLAAMEAEEGVPAPFEEKETSEYIPRFAGAEAEVKGTDRGTAYHTLMQLLDFGAFLDCSERKDYEKKIGEQTDRLKKAGKLTDELLEKINLHKIISFLMTETAGEMGEASLAGRLYKEQPFVIGVKASEVDPSFPDTETMLVQGVIDVYYIRNGAVKVLDYKTDRVTDGSELVKRYRTQLDYYSEALEKLTGLKTESRIIYSFGLEEVILL